MSTSELPAPDRARMQHRLAALSAPEVGGTANDGVDRPALSDADKAARDLLWALMEELGLAVRVDDLGSMYGRRGGRDSGAAPVLVGSHLDTVSPGGRFDGILGVVAALEVVSLLEEAGAPTRRPVEVVNWTAEEGARFAPAMLASGAVAGVHNRDFVYARADAVGRTFGEELERIGYRGGQEHRPQKIHASLEVHIEQGTVLEDNGDSVGVVEGIAPVRWHQVTVRGRGEHAGGPGLRHRRDAGVAAARMMVEARDLALAADDFKTTVGSITAQPGSTNVVPHTVRFSLDVRAATDERLDDAVRLVTEAFAGIATHEGVEVVVDETWRLPPTEFDPDLRDLIEATAARLGHRSRRLLGGIGHDSMYLAQITRAALIFTPTVGGLSHCEQEDSPWQDITKAVEVLAHVTAETAST
jgi:beta-ureidopropionase / N-carbamoyl-L-amino-acid hydrolase